MRVPVFSALAALLLAAAAQSQEPKPPLGPDKGLPGPERVFQRLDANHDGFLTSEELPRPLRERLGERFAPADKNGDKKLDRSEFATVWKDWPLPGPFGPFGSGPGGPRHFPGKGPPRGFGFGEPKGPPPGPPFGPPPGRLFDKAPDGGGPLDPAKPPKPGPKESPPFEAQGTPPVKKGPPPGKGDPLRAIFKRLDRDGNGQLSYEEFAAGAGRLLGAWAGPGRFAPPAFGPSRVGPPGFGPPGFGPRGFGPRGGGPRPLGPVGPPWLQSAPPLHPKAAWWYRGVRPGLRHTLFPARLALAQGPLGWTPWRAWARFGGFGPRRFGPPGPLGPPPWAGGGAAALMARFDANHDGKLSRGESPPRLAERFDSIDRNHDGFLTPDEIRAAASKAFRAPKPGFWAPPKPPKPYKEKPQTDAPKRKPPPHKPAVDKPVGKPAPDKPPKDKPPVGA